MNFDQTYISVYCDLEFIIDTIYFNNVAVQTAGGGGGGGTYVFLRKHCSSFMWNILALGNVVGSIWAAMAAILKIYFAFLLLNQKANRLESWRANCRSKIAQTVPIGNPRPS